MLYCGAFFILLQCKILSNLVRKTCKLKIHKWISEWKWSHGTVRTVDKASQRQKAAWSQVECQWHFSLVIWVVFRLIYSAMRNDKCLFLHDHHKWISKWKWSNGTVDKASRRQKAAWSQVEVQWHFSLVIWVVFRLIY
jgi:hypothetical protein